MRSPFVGSLRRSLLACTVLVAAVGGASAQLPPSAFRNVEPTQLGLDALNRGGVWTLHFAYMPPRIATIDTPDKGKRTVWYMPYYVYNKTGLPRPIVPKFELVTKDPDGVAMSSLDELQPSVVEALRDIEDPKRTDGTRRFNYQTSVSISSKAIPVAKPDTYPQSQAVHGIAVWLDVPEKANPNNFSVYVDGLSNGLAKKELVDKDKGETRVVVSRKTLRIDFRRPVAAKSDRTDDIQVNDNNGIGAEQWMYRESSQTTTKAADAPKKDGDK
jgi:hypothetical protein